MASLSYQKEISFVTAICVYVGSIVTIFTLLARHLADQIWLIILASLLGMVAVALLGIALALVRHTSSLALLFLCPIVAVIIISRAHPTAIAGAIFLGLSLWLARNSLRQEITDRIRYQTKAVFWFGSWYLLLGVLLAGLGIAYPIVLQKTQTNRLKLESRQLETVLVPVEPVLENTFPGYNLHQTIDQLAMQKIEASSEARLSNQPTVIISSETLPQLLARTTNQTINRLLDQHAQLVALIIIVTLFLALPAIIPLLRWLVLPLIAVLVWLLKRVEVIYLVRTPELADHLQFTIEET